MIKGAKYIIFCDTCYAIFYSELQQQRLYKWANVRLSKDDLAKHLKPCETQFLDWDGEVKSCLEAYIEQLSIKYKKILTPHKSDTSCNECLFLKMDAFNRATRQQINAGTLDYSKIRCSRHVNTGLIHGNERNHSNAGG